MKKFLIFIFTLTSSSLITPQIHAGYSCKDTPWGTRRCTGTQNGQDIDVQIKETPWGTQKTYGTVGGSSFTQECKETPWGTTQCN